MHFVCWWSSVLCGVVLTLAMEQGGRAAAYLPNELRETEEEYGTPFKLKPR